MDWYEGEVRALEKQLCAGSGAGRPAVFYGSSSIRMWTDLARDMGDARACNMGFGGSTLAACEYFFDRLVPGVNPMSLVIYAGDNDLGDGQTPEEVLASFSALADRIKRALPLIEVGFISIKISPAREGIRERIRQTNALIGEEIMRRPLFYYVDVAEAMLDGAGEPRCELYMEDGLHLNEAGYALWTRLLQPYRNRIFTPPSPETRPSDGILVST